MSPLGIVRLCASAAVAVCCAACTSSPVEPASGSLDPIVSMPVRLSPVLDVRREFAAVFAAELEAGRDRRAAAPGRRVDDWLHGVADVGEAERRRAAAIENAFPARAPSTAVLIVPGIFDDCFDDQSVPFGDGLVRARERSPLDAYGAFSDLGLASLRSITLPGRRSSASNGALVARAIREEAARPGVARVVIVAYSKGLSDTLHALAALQATNELPPSLAALVSVAGVVMGTPYADQFARAFEALSPMIDPLGCSPSDGLEVTSLTRRERVAWLVANPLPAGLRYHSIVAHAPSGLIAPALRGFHGFLGRIDARNDGQILASDAVLPAGELIAEARADHWDVALPRDRHPSWLMRVLTSRRGYPREALLRATLKWVVATDPVERPAR